MAIPYPTAKFKSANIQFWAQPPNLIPANLYGITLYFPYSVFGRRKMLTDPVSSELSGMYMCMHILVHIKHYYNYVKFDLVFSLPPFLP